MLITELEVSNFCQHEYQHFQGLGPGLIGVIGPVGSGKSNLLGALRYAITGDCANAGALADNVRQGTADGSRSFVRAAFRHGQSVGTVTRTLKPNTPTTLLRPGQEPMRGDKKVNAWFDDLLRLPKGVLENIVFAPQDDMFGFLADTPAKRLELFQKLFGTEHAEAVYNALGRKLSAPNSVPTADLAQLEREIAQCQLELQTAQTELQQLASAEELQAGLTQVEVVLQQARQQMASVQRCTVLQSQITQLEAQLASTRQATVDNRTRYDSLLAEETRLEPLQAPAEQALNTQRIRTSLLQRSMQLTTDLTRLRSQVAALTPPAEVPGYSVAQQGDLDTVVKRMHAAQDMARHLAARIAAFAATGVASCPTCGTPVASIAPLVPQWQQQHVAAAQRAEQLLDLRNRVAIYVEVQRQYVQQHQLLTSQLTMLEQQLASLEIPVEDPLEAMAAETLRQYRAARQERMGLEATTRAQEHQLRELDNQLATGRTELSTLLMSLGMTVVPTAGVSGDVRGIEAYEQTRLLQLQLIDRRRQADASSQRSAGALQARQQQYETVRLQLQSADQQRLWREQVTRVRDAFHRSAAPFQVIRSALQQVATAINACLERFQADYRVRVDDSTTFVVTFGDGREHAADRLSCGQRVLLLVSWRVALNCLFADNLGLLVLDEPTAFLDEHHIRGFEPVLDWLRGYAAGRGLQVFLITHERQLAPLFDEVIDLARH